jgi:sec-independent protein translocase protein TatA
MPSLGPAEILVVLVVALLVFGPNKMPEIARQVGKGFREFKRVQQHLKSELRDVVSEFDAPSAPVNAPGPDPVPMLPPKDDAAPPTVADAGAPLTAELPASSPAPEPDAPADPA